MSCIVTLYSIDNRVSRPVVRGTEPRRPSDWNAIDVFLWFMARHGFTLQRSRARQNFDDLDVLLDHLDEVRRQAFTDAMQKQNPAANTITP